MREFRPLSNTIFPPVVKNLLIINGIFFLASNVLPSSLGIDLYEHLSLYYFTSEKFRVWQLITHLFMHGDIMHIFGNMLALWMFGSVLENYWGSKKFLNYYLLTGLGAALIHLLVRGIELNEASQQLQVYLNSPTVAHFREYIGNHVPEAYQESFNRILAVWQNNPASLELKNNSISIANELYTNNVDSPTIGASGAVFGLLLAFGMLFPNVMIYVYFFLPIKAKYFVLLYGAFELYNGFVNNPGDNVAHFAHLGGMLIGFILIKIWKIKKPD